MFESGDKDTLLESGDEEFGGQFVAFSLNVEELAVLKQMI